jgi:hypothetical protein
MMFDDIEMAYERLKAGGEPDFVPLVTAAKALNVSKDELLQRAARGDIEISIIFNHSFESSKTVKLEEHEVNTFTLPNGKTVPAIKPYYVLVESTEKVDKEKSYVFCGVAYRFVCDSSYFGLVGLSEKDEKKCDPIETNRFDDCTYRHFIEKETISTKRNLFISLEDFLFLSANQLAIKAHHDNQPTAEQLQQQLDEANARIAELEAAQSNDTKQPIQQQREQALLFWVEGVGRDTVQNMGGKQKIHEALKKIDPIFHFSDFDKFWQKQKVIKLEAGKPTRNIG